MNIEILNANWKKFKGTLKQELGELTDDDWLQVEGDTDRLIGLIQEKYGVTKETARDKLGELLNNAASEVRDK